MVYNKAMPQSLSESHVESGFVSGTTETLPGLRGCMSCISGFLVVTKMFFAFCQNQDTPPCISSHLASSSCTGCQRSTRNINFPASLTTIYLPHPQGHAHFHLTILSKLAAGNRGKTRNMPPMDMALEHTRQQRQLRLIACQALCQLELIWQEQRRHAPIDESRVVRPGNDRLRSTTVDPGLTYRRVREVVRGSVTGLEIAALGQRGCITPWDWDDTLRALETSFYTQRQEIGETLRRFEEGVVENHRAAAAVEEEEHPTPARDLVVAGNEYGMVMAGGGSSTTEKKLEDLTAGTRCLVCLENPEENDCAVFVVVPCGHGVFCSRCVGRMKERSIAQVCPVCKDELDWWQRVYI